MEQAYVCSPLSFLILQAVFYNIFFNFAFKLSISNITDTNSLDDVEDPKNWKKIS